MSKHPMAPELPTLDDAALSSVTGGVTAPAASGSVIETALTALLSSIRDLATSQQRGGGMPDMMPMMMMMMMHQGSSAPAVAEPPIGQVTASGWTRVS
ncbi:hypothetical protein BH11MYX1_BH11MYX1_35970 [soil metagenome]